MSVEYEVFIGRGFMFGENGVPTFKEYCDKVKIDPEEAFEIFQNEDLVVSNCYSYDWMENIFFGYRLFTIEADATFDYKRLSHLDINVEQEHKMEEKFNEVFGEYLPILNYYVVERAY